MNTGHWTLDTHIHMCNIYSVTSLNYNIFQMLEKNETQRTKQNIEK